MVRISLTICLALAASGTLAQECSALLSQGVYDIRSTSIDLATASSYSQWFCDKKFSTSDQANDFGASLAFPFKGLPVKLGFDSSSQNYSTWQTSFCGNVKQDQSLQSKVRDYIQTVNPQIIQAFNQCLESNGLHVWLERTPDPVVFKFAARWNPPDSERDPTTTIKSFNFGKNVKCAERPKKVSNSEFRTRCVRQDAKAVIGTVTTKPGPIRGGGNLSLPEILPPITVIPTPPGALCTDATGVLTEIYRLVLEREPDKDGLYHNVAFLTGNQLNVRQLVSAFAQSLEHTKRFVNGRSDSDVIKVLYKHILGRDGEADGIAHNTALLPSVTYPGMVNAFANSREYDQAFGNWVVPGSPSKVKYCH